MDLMPHSINNTHIEKYAIDHGSMTIIILMIWILFYLPHMYIYPKIYSYFNKFIIISINW